MRRKTSAAPSFFTFAGGLGMLLLLAFCGYYAASTIDVQRYMDAHHRQQHGQLMAPIVVGDMIYVDLPGFIAEVTHLGESRQVHVQLAMEVSEKDAELLKSYQPRIADKLNRFIASVDLNEFRKSGELPWLRSELLREVNSAGAPQVHNLILRQLVIM